MLKDLLAFRSMSGVATPAKSRPAKTPQQVKPAKVPLPPEVITWYDGKDFSNDWTTHKIAPWFDALNPYKSKPVAVLEIGSWEGRSAIAFLEILDFATITCVDTFGGSPNHVTDESMKDQLSMVEMRFDANLAAHHGRVRKIKGRSVPAMDSLIAQNEQFDVVYIDASHRRDDVLVDSIIAWRLLKVGGLMIWDDLRFHLEWPAPERPADAILMFCTMFGQCMEEIHRGKQLLATKTGEWPSNFTVPAPTQQTSAV